VFCNYDIFPSFFAELAFAALIISCTPPPKGLNKPNQPANSIPSKGSQLKIA
jgi:hypothetical protein